MGPPIGQTATPDQWTEPDETGSVHPFRSDADQAFLYSCQNPFQSLMLC